MPGPVDVPQRHRRRKSVEARPYDVIAIIGDDGVVIGMGWLAPGAQGDMRPFSDKEAAAFRSYFERRPRLGDKP